MFRSIPPSLAGLTLKEKEMRYEILILPVALLLIACKSYDLKPVGENVKIIEMPSSLLDSIGREKDKPDSPFSKCKFLGKIKSDGGSQLTNKEYGTANEPTYFNARNDIANQSGILGANVAFIRGSYSDLIGSAYQCESLETLLTLQKTWDEQEKKRQEIEKEKKLAELYSKPHYWLICGKSPHSRVLPSMTSAALRDFKPKAFEKQDSAKCGDEAAIKNMLATNFGIACICTDKEVKLDRQKIEAEFGGAEIN